MGKRRKKYRKVIRKVKRIPDVFICPNCGSKSIGIWFEKVEGETSLKLAKVTCGSCNLYWEVVVPSILEAVDVYSKLIDEFEKGNIVVQR